MLEIPTIKIIPPQDARPLREAVTAMGEYDWVLFTSPNGVEAFFQAFFAAHKDLREIGGVKIGAVGQATAEKVNAFHLEVDFLPKEFTTDGLLREFRAAVDCENLRFLLPGRRPCRQETGAGTRRARRDRGRPRCLRDGTGDRRSQRPARPAFIRGRGRGDVHQFEHGDELLQSRGRAGAPGSSRSCSS